MTYVLAPTLGTGACCPTFSAERTPSVQLIDRRCRPPSGTPDRTSRGAQVRQGLHRESPADMSKAPPNSPSYGNAGVWGQGTSAREAVFLPLRLCANGPIGHAGHCGVVKMWSRRRIGYPNTCKEVSSLPPSAIRRPGRRPSRGVGRKHIQQHRAGLRQGNSVLEP